MYFIKANIELLSKRVIRELFIEKTKSVGGPVSLFQELKSQEGGCLSFSTLVVLYGELQEKKLTNE